MKLAALILATLGIAAGANPPVLSNILLDDVTHSQARIGWNTDVVSTTKVKFGPTSSWGCTINVTSLNSVTTHSWFISGTNAAGCQLTPGMTVHYSVCSSDTSEQCSADATFALSALPSPHPAVPIAPTAVASDTQSEPTINGMTLTTDSTCSNLAAHLATLAAVSSSNNHLIKIPASAACDGRWQLPVQTGTGYIVIKTDTTLPAFGTQVVPATYQTSFATLRSNILYAIFSSSTFTGACTGSEDAFGWNSSSMTFDLARCLESDHQWHAVSAASSGTSVPGTCAQGDWFFKTNYVSHELSSSWWCLTTNNYTMVQWTNYNVLEDSAVIYTAANAGKYRIEGVNLKHIGIPSNDTTRCGGGTSSGRPIGCFGGMLAVTLASNDRIFFDRVIIDGVGYPQRQWYGIQLDGSNVGVESSYCNELNFWFPDHSMAENESTCINIKYGPGPIRIYNNYFKNCVGICVYHSDDAGNLAGTTQADDGTLLSNTFDMSDAFSVQSRFTNGHYYFRRHHFELKRGRRWLIAGNTFKGGFTTVNQGASIGLSPRPGADFNLSNTIELNDIDIGSRTLPNYFWNTPIGIYVVGHHDGSGTTGPVQTHGFRRFRVTYNKVYAVNTTLGVDGGGCTICTKQSWSGAGVPSGVFLQTELHPEDLTFQHNTVYGTLGNYSELISWSGQYDILGEGLLVKDNLAGAFSLDVPSIGGIWWDGANGGTAGLDKAWSQYSVTNNALQNSGGDPGGYPGGNYWETSGAGFKFKGTSGVSYDDTGVDLCLAADSAYLGTGARPASDGLNMGYCQDASAVISTTIYGTVRISGTLVVH